MMMKMVRLELLVIYVLMLVSFTIHSQIVTVIDSRLAEQNRNLARILEKSSSVNLQMKVIISNESDTLSTFDKVCEEIQSGAVVLVDMSSSEVGRLLSSFARSNGLIFVTVKDEALPLPVDRLNPLYLLIEPPGSAMIQVVADIVRFDNLTNAAILYDESFNLHEIPRRIISGLTSHHIYQQINQSEEGMRDLVNQLQELQIENIFIIGNSNSIDFVLGRANSLGMLGDDINWFAITKDARITCAGCRQKMEVVTVDGKYIYQKMTDYNDYMIQTIDSQFDVSKIKVDEAFAYDLAQILKDSIPLDTEPVNTLSCDGNQNQSTSPSLQAQRIIDNFQKINHSGVFGRITYKPQRRALRQSMTLELVKEIYQNGESIHRHQLGFWTERDGVNVSRGSIVHEKVKKRYKIVIVPEYPPFIYRHVNTENGSQIEYSGFCIDLLDKVAQAVDFEYEIHESPDTFFGSLNDDGTWNGAINELVQKHADIAVGPISVMSERENVVDFTVQFHEPVGLNILMRKQKFEYSLHRFLLVLEPSVWGFTIVSYFLFSVLMWLFDRFSPYSYQNKPDKCSLQEKRVFNLKEGIWFCMTSLTPQGGGEAPRALSGRLVAATWWLYGFLLIAFYTANLAAFLTVVRLETPITSLDDLSKQRHIKYGPLNGTSALVYFERMKNIEEQFYRIWKDMSLNDSMRPVERAKLAVWDYPVSEKFTKLMESMSIKDSSEKALASVLSGDFAFIDDATRNRYQALINCDVEVIGEEFSRKPFAFAVAQGSQLRSQISNAILDLTNDRVVEGLTTKWWHENKAKVKDCPRIENESDGITMENIGGVFLVIAVGTGLSFIALAVEFYFYRYKPKRDAKLYSVNKKKGRKKTLSEQNRATKTTRDGNSASKPNRANHINMKGHCASSSNSTRALFDCDSTTTLSTLCNGSSGSDNNLYLTFTEKL